MCTILFAYKVHEEYDLVLLANRDEFYQRPTQEAHWWDEASKILAGRDLKACGTWLGVNEYGSLSALTNYRDFRIAHDHKLSRGEIVLDYLKNNKSIGNYLELLAEKAVQYDLFNVLLYNQDGLRYYNNMTQNQYEVEEGVHGLSNHFLDSPWFKVRTGKEQLKRLIDKSADINIEECFEILGKTQQADEIELPNTGVGKELEKILSSMHIETETYGTRYKTVVLIGKEGHVDFYEKYLDSDSMIWNQHEFHFKIKGHKSGIDTK